MFGCTLIIRRATLPAIRKHYVPQRTLNEERRPPAGDIFMARIENRVCLGPYTETLPKPEAAHEKSLAPRVMSLWNTSLDK